jgi:hypothetical protein
MLGVKDSTEPCGRDHCFIGFQHKLWSCLLKEISVMSPLTHILSVPVALLRDCSRFAELGRRGVCMCHVSSKDFCQVILQFGSQHGVAQVKLCGV